jgi:beta-xylosidase
VLRNFFCSLSIVAAAFFAHVARAADNGDGTFTNPPLNADFPDPDIIRVGDDYYMVSTTFVNSPGLALLRSKDLVNWTTINNVIPRLAGDPRYDMTGGPLYRNGVFAPSIRYNNGTFYVAVQPNGTGQGLQIYHTTDPAGSWQLNQLSGGAFDPGLFFEDDGTPYVVYGGAWQNNTYARRLNSTLTGFAGAEQVIQNNGFGIEGAHVIKKDGYYYRFSSRPGNLSMYVSRSTNLFSGWQTQLAITDGTGSGHQGAVVEMGDGNWYGFAMLDSGPIGRVTNISPISWANDWPVWGDNNVVPSTAPKPIAGQPILINPVSTGFDSPTLLPDYRWNHNPDNARWSLTERPGYLRLKPNAAPDFWNARNSLTYKGFGPTSQAVVELDISNLRIGDSAGLGMLGKGLATLALNRLAGGNVQLSLSTGTATATTGPVTQQASAALGTPTTVYLTLRMDFENSEGQTAYSLDGTNWSAIGNSFPLLWDWATGTFQGEQYALFNYSAGASNGYVDVNRFTFVHRSDLDQDGDIDVDDYVLLYTNHFTTLTGDSPLETHTYGDVDGDLDNDFDDFRMFKNDYIRAHSEDAFNAAVASVQVPEPFAGALALLALSLTTHHARQANSARRRPNPTPPNR